MSLHSSAIQRPVFTMMVTLIIVLLGAVSLNRLPIDLMPDITNPTISVFTTYENASPEEMEELITRPIEEAVSAVPGVDEVSSSSSEGTSRVRVTFTWGTDLDAAANDVRDRLDRAARLLPEESDRPTLFKFDLASFPILILGASSGLDPIQMQNVIEDQVKYRIERLPGVAAMEAWGGLEREIHINLDMDRLRALGLSFDSLVQRITTANVTRPSGTVDRGTYEITLRTPGEFTNLDELRETAVAVREGVVIRLGDVARVEDSWVKVRQVVRVDGKPGVRLSVTKQSGANTVDVADRVLQEIERINADLPQIRITPIIDTSDYIRRSITNVGSSAIYGGGLALLVLFFFLSNLRTTAVIGTAIPVSIIASFILLYFSGYTLNIMTLGGLALAVGMLVDNSIVVLENIFRLREGGRGRLEAAEEGTGEVWAAVMASTLTTVVVFLPMLFVRGMSGVMFRQLAIVVSFSLLCSLASALTLVPMLAARIPVGSTAESRSPHGPGARTMRALEGAYRRLLAVGLRHRLATLTAMALVLGLCILLVPRIGVELLPATDEGEVRVNVEMDVGTRLELLSEKMREIEAVVREAVPEARNVVMSIGGSRFGSSPTHEAEMRIALVPAGKRERSSEEIAGVLRRKLVNRPGMAIRTRAGQGLFIFRIVAGNADRIQVEVRGHDLATADTLARRVQAMVEEVPGVTDAQLSRKAGKPEEIVRVDRARTADLGLTVEQIADALETVLSGTLAGYYREGGKEYGIRVQAADSQRFDLDRILGIPLINPAGEAVVLRNAVTIEPRSGPVLIERKNQERIVTVSANVSGRDTGSVARDIQARLRGIPVPRDFQIAMSGDVEEQQKSFRELLLSFGLALCLVYMVMACQYESLRDPFVVMFSVPFAAIGVILMLYATNTTFNVQSYIGCIMLGGIVVNNAIVLVDHTNLLRRRDRMPLREAIEEAARRRLRPILMTTLTTILGLGPLALGLGEGGEAQAPLARAVIGGLLSSTLITLVLVPVVYSLVEGLHARLHRRGAAAAGAGLVLAALGALAVPDAALGAADAPGPAATNAAAAARPEPAPAWTLTIEEAVFAALEGNRELAVRRLDPLRQETAEQVERAAFDPVLGASATRSDRDEVRSTSSRTNRLSNRESTTAELALDTVLPTGTRLALEGGAERTDDATTGDGPSSVRLGLGVSQSLLRGRGIAVNLAGLRQARIDTAVSRYELRGFVESLVADVERTCWDFVLAERQIDIVEKSLRVAEEQRDELEQRIRVGKLPEIEMAAAEAEVALRREALIRARGVYERSRLRLVRLLNAPGTNRWERPLALEVDADPARAGEDPVAEHVEEAMRMRPELNQARLGVRRQDLEVAKTRNGLLPVLDVFVTLGRTGYARSFEGAAGSPDEEGSDVTVGLAGEYPLGRRADHARLDRALVGGEQARLALENLRELVELDVRSAHIDVRQAREQIAATGATRRRQEEKLRAEMEKFRVGRTTSLLVAQAQRDLLQSQVAEVQAVAGYFKALVDLWRLDGSLLERRGIDAPGREPVPGDEP